jgi:hypothetical protein
VKENEEIKDMMMVRKKADYFITCFVVRPEPLHQLADLSLVLLRLLNIDGHANCLRVLRLGIIPLFELTLGPSFESI